MSEFILSGFSDEISENIIEQFKKLNELGMEYFEVRGVNGKNISDLTEEEVYDLYEKMQEYNVKVSSIGSPVGKIDILEDENIHYELLKKIIKTAKILKTKYIRMFSYFIPENVDVQSFSAEVIKRMKNMAKIAEENDVILLHENEKGIYGDTAERCYEILSEVNSSNFRAVFDPANFVQCNEDTKKAFGFLKDYIEYVHIKDAKSDKTVVPAGEGEGNLKYILSRLKSMNYKGFLSLEPHLGVFGGLENLEQDDSMLQLEKSNFDKFKLAYDSLIKILKEM